MKIKKNDTVLIISGKEKGKKGKVMKVFPENFRIVVEGVNLVKKHTRPRRQGEKGQIVHISKSISAANVKIVCPKCGQATRVGYRITEGDKLRICKKCKQEI